MTTYLARVYTESNDPVELAQWYREREFVEVRDSLRGKGWFQCKGTWKEDSFRNEIRSGARFRRVTEIRVDFDQMLKDLERLRDEL